MQTMVYLQTGTDQEPMFATCEHTEVLSTIEAMVRREDGDNGTLAMYVNDGMGKDESDAILYYLGMENERDAITAYDGTDTYTNKPGTEVFLMVRPMPAPGEVVGLWDEKESDDE